MIPEDVRDSPSCQKTLPPKKYRFQKYIPSQKTHISCVVTGVVACPSPDGFRPFFPFPFIRGRRAGLFMDFIAVLDR